jgi:hypothetical protein
MPGIDGMSPDDEEDLVLERMLCHCGRLADVVVTEADGDVWAAVRCGCGTFVPAAAGDGSRP